MIEFAWFIVGLTFGACGTIGYVTYLGHREIAKRNKRSQNWQKTKKEIDEAIMKEWDI